MHRIEQHVDSSRRLATHTSVEQLKAKFTSFLDVTSLLQAMVVKECPSSSNCIKDVMNLPGDSDLSGLTLHFFPMVILANHI